jgi:plasmid rolling circle replication initiator protein Rep
MSAAKAVCWRGYVTLNGRTTLQLEVFRNKRATNGRRLWALYRTSNHSRDNFVDVYDAMACGSRLNPKIEWRKEMMEAL